MTKKERKLPSVKIPECGKVVLPFNGSAVTEKSLSFSFACFDKRHELFNLGGEGADGVVSGKWFIELLDCLKSVCNMTIPELRQTKTHEMHPIDWKKTNTNPPAGSEQLEYWQIRISKSKGRVIGLMIDGIFYVVWLDPHHNLTNSEGYGGVKKYAYPNG
ncbi:MAG: hypothetical protein IJP85_05675 [Synergistaceae bacterium]|nr:hypothetical protein [Synergistaceae bacterium]